jgi:hypothetical protein
MNFLYKFLSLLRTPKTSAKNIRLARNIFGKYVIISDGPSYFPFLREMITKDKDFNGRFKLKVRTPDINKFELSGVKFNREGGAFVHTFQVKSITSKDFNFLFKPTYGKDLREHLLIEITPVEKISPTITSSEGLLEIYIDGTSLTDEEIHKIFRKVYGQ